MIPITRTDADIERTINWGQRWPSSADVGADPDPDSYSAPDVHRPTIRSILEMFIVSEVPVHILRGVEPNLRYGGAIKQYFDELSSPGGGRRRSIPRCPLADAKRPQEARKCIHLASRKQIGDAIIRYEDQSII